MKQNLTPQEFAALVLSAQEIREKSYIDLGSLELNVARSENAAYAVDQNGAAIKACQDAGVDLKWSMPIYFLNLMTWNDIQAWAEGVVP